MAISAFQQALNRLFKQFTLRMGREPQTPAEWMNIQNEAVRLFNKTKGDPQSMINQRYRDARGIGFNPKVIQGGKKEGIESLLKSGDVKVGVAPKTTAKTLADKKDRHILFRDAEEDIARIKRENKQAIEDFKKRHGKKTVEDFRDEGDYDPGGFAGGGLVKEFIERLFIKASNDIRQGKGKWKGLTQDQWIKQHDDLTKMMKKWEWGGKKRLPEGAEQYLGMNDLQIARAVKQAEAKAKRLGKGKNWKEQEIKAQMDEKKDEILKNLTHDFKGRPYKDVAQTIEGTVVDEKLMQKAYDEIKGGSGFTDDYKYDADILAEEYARQHGKVYADLPEDQISIYYDPALKRVSQDMLKRREARKALKDVEQKIELQMFDPKDRLPNQSGGLAYMLGEPTYMKMADGGDVPSPEEFLNDKHYNELRRLMDEYEQYKKNYDKEKQRRSGIQEVASGGKVGHGPWTTGQTPPGPQTQPEMPQPQVMGTPDPMKAPRLPSVAPRNMDPQYMQQQRMQQAMMQQGIPQGIPRVGMMYGGDPGFAFEYGGSWADWHDQHRNAMPIEDYIQTKLPKERLPFRENFSKGGMTRRAFLKMMGALSALPFIGKGVQKAAPKAIKEVTETIARDADGIPTYAFDLIEVVKAKGTKEIMEGLYKRNPPATKYTYKDVEVVEDGLGTTSVKKSQTKTGSWHDEATDDTLVDDYVDREVGFEIRKGEDIVKDEGLETQKVIRGADEYDESTAIMQGDPDGGMDVSEVLEEISDADHLDLKKIADEVKDIRTKKASGGLAYMLGE